MPETLTFHFEGALADDHKMNFYESARFQYATARLMVKLAQFRENGRFVQKITNNSNFDIQLTSQGYGSFNINVEDPGQGKTASSFITIPISDLIAYVSERVVEKIDEATLANMGITAYAFTGRGIGDGKPATAIDQLAEAVMAGKALTADLPVEVRELGRIDI